MIRDVTNQEWVVLKERYEKAQKELDSVQLDIKAFCNQYTDLPVFKSGESAYQFKYDYQTRRFKPEFLGYCAPGKLDFLAIKQAVREA